MTDFRIDYFEFDPVNRVFFIDAKYSDCVPELLSIALVGDIDE